MSAPNWKLIRPPDPPAPGTETPQRVEAARTERRKNNAAAVRRKNRAEAVARGMGDFGHPATTEVDYSAAEVEFAMALDRYKREKRRPFPTNREILKVLLDLGYRKHGGSPCDSTPPTSPSATSSGA